MYLQIKNKTFFAMPKIKHFQKALNKFTAGTSTTRDLGISVHYEMAMEHSPAKRSVNLSLTII